MFEGRWRLGNGVDWGLRIRGSIRMHVLLLSRESRCGDAEGQKNRIALHVPLVHVSAVTLEFPQSFMHAL